MSGSSPTATAIAVTGGAGAVGLHFIRHVLTSSSLTIRVLVHRTPLPSDLETPRVLQFRGSLLEPASLDQWLCPGAAVVHLAWSSSMTLADQLRSAEALTDTSYRHNVARLVHCSTAVVAGRAPARVVTEETPCEPANDYERHKYRIEQAMETAAAGRFPLTVVRPTAVFGPGLQNLVRLVDSHRNGRALVNYARAALFGRRHLHLVPVETVVSALLFAALARDQHEGTTPVRYIVSADDEPGGDFASIEERVRRGLGLGAGFPAVKLPAVVLRLVLRASGRSDTDPQRRYDGSRLRQAGFVPPVKLDEAVDRYLAWYRTKP